MIDFEAARAKAEAYRAKLLELKAAIDEEDEEKRDTVVAELIAMTTPE